MIASLSRVRRLEPRFFGPIRSSDVDSRAFHLAIVLRLTPYRSARTVFFSSLAWIARRTLGVGAWVVFASLGLAFAPLAFCLNRPARQRHPAPKSFKRLVRPAGRRPVRRRNRLPG